jgi:hypothetical protein
MWSSAMQQRRFKQIQSLEEHLAEEAKRLREEAKLLSPGAVREQVGRQAPELNGTKCIPRRCA